MKEKPPMGRCMKDLLTDIVGSTIKSLVGRNGNVISLTLDDMTINLGPVSFKLSGKMKFAVETEKTERGEQ